MGDISEAIEEIEQSLLNTDFSILTRSFLNYFIEDNCVSLSFQQLRQKYVTRFDTENSEFLTVPKDEEEFYKEICKTYLYLEPNDPSNLKQKVQTVVADLRKIEEDKSGYLRELEELKKKEFEEGKNYKERLLIHFIKKQEEAEAQILSYIKKNLLNETNLNKYSFLKSFLLFPDYTYHYNFAPHIYKLEYLSEIRNKLESVVLRRFNELEKLFRTDKTKFLEELKKDFNLADTINSIKETVLKNRRLSQRKVLIDDILELLKQNKLQLFCNVVPQQIEGIMYDYCLEFGIEENSLKNSTIGDKINLLMEKGNSDVDYEYFAFIFPLIRNRVAHGKLIEHNLDLNTWLLLLDLKSSCEWLLSDKLLTNRNIDYVNNLNESTSLVEFLKIAPIIRSGIHEFYSDARNKLNEQKEVLRMKLRESDFPFNEVTSENKNIILENLHELKKIGLNDQECKKIIDKINST